MKMTMGIHEGKQNVCILGEIKKIVEVLQSFLLLFSMLLFMIANRR